MTGKEMQIRSKIIPQLDSLAARLFDISEPAEGRRLDKIIDELTAILNQEDN